MTVGPDAGSSGASGAALDDFTLARQLWRAYQYRKSRGRNAHRSGGGQGKTAFGARCGRRCLRYNKDQTATVKCTWTERPELAKSQTGVEYVNNYA